MAGFLAGDSAWLAIMVGGALCLAAGLCFSELNGVLPSAAGIRLYFGRAFGDRIALTVSLLYMFVVMGVVGAESFVLAKVLNEALPRVAPIIWILMMMVTVTLLNIRGIKLAGNFQDIITYGLMISLVVFALLGLGRVDFQLTTPLAPGGALALLNAVAVGVFLFVGFEWVTPLAEEVTENGLVAKGMFIAIGLLCVIYSLLTVAITANVPRELLANSPVPHMLFAREVLGGAGVAWMVAISLAASITTFNAGLISVSRFFYATAREHALPAVFSKITYKYLTPWVAIVGVFAVGMAVSVFVLYTGHYLVFVNMAAAMESLVYAMTGIAVIVLRKKLKYDPQGPVLFSRGPALPALVSLVFAVLALAVLATDLKIALLMFAGLIVAWLYVTLVVPVLKERHQAKRKANRRRPGAANR